MIIIDLNVFLLLAMVAYLIATPIESLIVERLVFIESAIDSSSRIH